MTEAATATAETVATTTASDATTASTTTTAATTEAGGESLLTAATTTQAGQEWIVDKYAVKKEDGTIDEVATARKQAEGYKALASKMGAGATGTVPETPADYKLEAPKNADGKPIEGIDMEAFTADPMFKGVAETAHKLGMSNEQLQGMVHQYLQLGPEIFGADKVLTAQEAKAELAKVWANDADMQAGLSGAVKAITAWGGKDKDQPGSTDRLMAKYGADPDFIAFAATLAKELGEDKPAGEGAAGTGLADADLEGLMKSEAYWKAEHPDHKKTVEKVQAHFAKVHGTGKVRGSI